MRRSACFAAAAIAVSSAFSAGTAIAAAPSVQLQVVGKSAILAGPKKVTASSFTTNVGSGSRRRSCTVAAGTPLAAIKAAGITVGIKDFGACSRKAADSASLYVDSIRSVAGTGMQGWSYKVDNRAGTAGAADPSGPFGSGLIKSGSRVLWFWCVYDPTTYACQRNLVITAPARGSVGVPLTVSVKACDDSGACIAASNVRVSIDGSESVVTSNAGTASFTPAAAGKHVVTAADASSGVARRPDAFSESVTVS
jgi:hypothetical protein